jgi:N-acyl-L-homoserine lactone synthetase
MLQFSSGTKHQLPPQLFEQMGRYRHEVFINRLGWELNTINGMELDEFDGPEAVYVCSHDDGHNVNGVARLLPTTEPYLMEKVFPHLLTGKQVPRDPQIWELSRFAAASLNTSGSITHQASEKHASELLRNVIRAGSQYGAQTLVTVSPIGMERILRLNNFQFSREGVPIVNKKTHIVSLSIKCNKLS